MYTHTHNYDLMWKAAKSSQRYFWSYCVAFYMKAAISRTFIKIKYEKENFWALQCMIYIFFYLKRGWLTTSEKY